MSKKRIAVLVVVVIIVAAAVIGAKFVLSPPNETGAMPNHITIAQAMADRSGQVAKVGGEVVPGSISWNGGSQSIQFTLTGEGDRMKVAYSGRPPNDFKPGSEVVVEGTYGSSGVFQASSLATRSSPLCKACHPGG